MACQYRAADVAACIIDTAIQMNRPVSNLQLQKLLFICQCTSLQHDGSALFPDAFVAWQYGPVVRSVYNTYSYRGASPLLRAAKYVNGCLNNEPGPVRILDNDARQLVGRVLNQWIYKPSWDLVRKIHEPGGAWDRVYNADGVEGSGFAEVIPVDLMRIEALA